MKRFIVITVIILIPLALATMYFKLLNSRPGTPGPVPEHKEQELRIGALNICHLGFNSDASVSAGVLADSAQENEIDVILLQEYKSHWKFDEKDFKSLFRKKGYKHVSIEGECACISKFPISSHKRVKFEDLSDTFSNILVTLPGKRTVEIFAVHLMTTGLNNFTDGSVPQEVAGVGSVSTFLSNGKIRKNQAVSLARRIERTLNPLIVAGDFNCVPWSAPYRQLTSAQMKDSFFEMGQGSGSTYRGIGDILRIDYIFYGSEFECTDSRVIDNEISDHKMVMSTFVLSDEVKGK
ncbi:MAG: endonuclease/exonuclease/phosphatase family protein [Candidatus Cryptobacteroides sp.]